MNAEAKTSARLQPFPVDAHVHFHRHELVAPTLDAAAANFSRASRGTGPLLGALLLAQSSRERVFEQLAEARTAEAWRFRTVAGEPQTLIARRGNRELAVVCGRQIRCALGLEALALGTTATHPDGSELADTVRRIVTGGALAVIPWGFGKWTGRAGHAVRGFFESCSSPSVFAGDNGGRLHSRRLPTLLRKADRAGFRVLPGTDPFPFGGDYRRAGSFGFLAPPLDQHAPLDSLRGWLVSGGLPIPYGRALHPLRFLLNQGGIQLYKRFAPGVPQ